MQLQFSYVQFSYVQFSNVQLSYFGLLPIKNIFTIFQTNYFLTKYLREQAVKNAHYIIRNEILQSNILIENVSLMNS